MPEFDFIESLPAFTITQTGRCDKWYHLFSLSWGVDLWNATLGLIFFPIEKQPMSKMLGTMVQILVVCSLQTYLPPSSARMFCGSNRTVLPLGSLTFWSSVPEIKRIQISFGICTLSLPHLYFRLFLSIDSHIFWCHSYYHKILHTKIAGATCPYRQHPIYCLCAAI